MKHPIKFTLIIFLIIGFLGCNGGSNGPIPPEEPEYLFIASCNIKDFGQTKLNDQARIDVIISIIKKYDIIAIQEIRDVSLTLPAQLIDKINATGVNYSYVVSDRLGKANGTREEQYLFIYDDDKLDFLQNTTGYGIEPNDEFARQPFYAMFRAGNFDFYLMNIHTGPNDVATEIPALKDAYMDLQDNTTPFEDDIILLGDFNARAPGCTVDSYYDMDEIATIPNIVFTIMEETNTSGGRAYDNIIFQSNYTTEYSSASGVYAFWTDYSLTEDQGSDISDHRVVWAKFRIDKADDDN